MVTSLDKEVGNRIVELRHQHKWTQEYLAELSELSPVHIGHMERGVHKQTVFALRNVCHAFGMTLSEFLQCIGEEGGAMPHPCQDSLPIMLRKQAD